MVGCGTDAQEPGLFNFHSSIQYSRKIKVVLVLQRVESSPVARVVDLLFGELK